MSSLKKRPFNETPRKCSQSWLKARADVSSSHLNKDSLINSLAAYIDETCRRRADAQAVLPPKFLQCYREAYWLLLEESHLTRRLFGAMVRRIAALPVPTG